MDRDEPVDTACGYTQSCKPKSLQKCANVKIFLLVLTLFGMVKGFAINGINNISTLMYERRYGLSSSESSLVSVLQDAATSVTVIAIGYYGSKGHQPRVLAVSILVMAVGTFTMCLAQFASPLYDPTGFGEKSDSNISGICAIGEEFEEIWDDEAKQKDRGLKGYLALLVIGQMLNGYCSACTYSLGYAFLEVSSPAAQSALYIGILTSGSVAGPAIGFLGGSSFLNVYVDFPRKPPAGLTPDDPSWVGAWWMGFLITSVLCLIFAAIMFLFPAELPATDEIRRSKVCEAHDNGTEEKINRLEFGTSWRQLPKATWYLFKNPCYVCITVVDAVELGIVVSLATFVSKFLVVQFNVNPARAGLLAGVLALPSAVIGQLGGGIIIKKWNMTLPQMLKLGLAMSVIAAGCVFTYFCRCRSADFAGVTMSYTDSESFTGLNLSSTCNEGCGCTTAFYDPVCANGVQYFSPCHAGCTEQPITTDDGEQIYQGCACAYQLGNIEVNVTHGMCEQPCKTFYPVFLPFSFLLSTALFGMSTPMTLSTLRVVPANLRTYGIALHGLFLRLLGSIPIPLLFGAMLDESCDIWQDKNGVKGTCWVYDNMEMAIRIVVLFLALKVISITFHTIAIVMYKPPSSSSSETSSTTDTNVSEKSMEKLDKISDSCTGANENKAYTSDTTDI